MTDPDHLYAPSRKTLWFRVVAAADVGPTGKLVAWALGSRMDAKATTYPSRQTIADDASVSLSTVKRALPEIEAAGLLRIDRSRGRRSHHYAGMIPPDLWDVCWSEEFIDRMLNLGVLNEDFDANGVSVNPLDAQPVHPTPPTGSSTAPTGSQL